MTSLMTSPSSAKESPSTFPVTNSDVKMEAPTPVENGGSSLHHWGCPLCHRDPIDPRVANCGHIYCLMCLRDVQVTAELFKYSPRCNLCHSDISDPQPVAFAPHRVLPPVAPANPNSQHTSYAPTVGEALAALHQRAADPRNYYASGLSGLESAFQHQEMQRPPHSRQMSRSDVPRYDGRHGIHLGHLPSSDQVVNTIESSPRASTETIQTPDIKEDRKPVNDGLKNLRFHLKGDFERDEEARKIIQQNGGRITAGATKHTDYIVMGAGARKTKAMKGNGGVVLNEAAFWELMQQKIGGVHQQFHSLYDEEELASEDTKLKLELAKLEKKTGEVKRKLEEIEGAKADIKKQKLEEAGLLDISNFVERSES